MNQQQLISTFDGQAQTYDQQWTKLSPFRDALHILVAAALRLLPPDARILCVGAGTGAEIQYLAGQFPHWTFTAVEPSAGMLGVCRARAEEHGYHARCTFHEGYLDTLPAAETFDAATCFLVSQFILEPHDRTAFFRAIADRLKPDGILASTDLAMEDTSTSDASLLEVWLRTMASVDASPAQLQKMREAYARDVAIVPPSTVASIIQAGGFDPPVRFYQVGLIHGWYARCATPPATPAQGPVETVPVRG